jgi:hypothetical protein
MSAVGVSSRGVLCRLCAGSRGTEALPRLCRKAYETPARSARVRFCRDSLAGGAPEGDARWMASLAAAEADRGAGRVPRVSFVLDVVAQIRRGASVDVLVRRVTTALGNHVPQGLVPCGGRLRDTLSDLCL